MWIGWIALRLVTVIGAQRRTIARLLDTGSGEKYGRHPSYDAKFHRLVTVREAQPGLLMQAPIKAWGSTTDA